MVDPQPQNMSEKPKRGLPKRGLKAPPKLAPKKLAGFIEGFGVSSVLMVWKFSCDALS